ACGRGAGALWRHPLCRAANGAGFWLVPIATWILWPPSAVFKPRARPAGRAERARWGPRRGGSGRAGLGAAHALGAAAHRAHDRAGREHVAARADHEPSVGLALGAGELGARLRAEQHEAAGLLDDAE